ncbi:MAG: glycoside hydrolase family 127 protein [Armatimonadetes bacterium]|nr:glycoside hydrolase family 127 protein [Armatimonadota bacterium]
MIPEKFRPLPLSDVKLLDSVFSKRQALNRNYMLGLKNENLLQNHYNEAGLWIPRKAPEGCHGGWEFPTCQLRGHFLGHWLWGAARTVAITGDAEMKAKADFIVSEIARCQKENGGEWAGPFPIKYLEWISRGKDVWAPQYTLHKNVMGLVEMYKQTGSQEALEVITKWAKWFHRWSMQFTNEQWAKIMRFETGGMQEAWADLYAETGDPEHLELARRYEQSKLWEDLLAGKDALSNRHTNSTVPEMMGAARMYEITGEKRYRDVLEAFWKCAVTDRGYFVTGGQSSGEMYTLPYELSPRFGENTQEHCTVYNMMRVADYLLRWTGDVVYSDYIERNMHNGILAQQNPDTGMVAYYLPMRPGSVKEWGHPTDHFWCCHGTLVQAHPIHATYAFYEDDEGIALSQFIPTEASWKWNDVQVLVTQTIDAQKKAPRRPKINAYEIAVEPQKPVEFALKVRLPWWLSGEANVTVNGEPIKIKSEPSSYISIKRTWNSGDKIHIDMPKALVAVPLPDDQDMVAFMDGPIVLAGLCDEERMLVGDKGNPHSMLVPDCEWEWGQWLTAYRTRLQERGMRFIPINEVRKERYTLYFPVKKG